MFRTVSTLVAITSLLVPAAAGAPASGLGCPPRLDPESVAAVDELHDWNAQFDAPRPTGSPANEAYIDWIEDQMQDVAGVQQTTTYPIEIDRWLEQSASLSVSVGGTTPKVVPPAGAVPYSQETTGVTAPVVYLPPGTAITPGNAGGKIVVRDVVPGIIQNAVFAAVEWFIYDPDLTLLPTENYERDWVSAGQRIQDLVDAEVAGAAAVLFVHPFPRAQVQGYYAPYEGRFWEVPALYLGVDEGEEIKEDAADGNAVGTVAIAADRTPAQTRSITFLLPGVSPERIVVSSHTDGTNAMEENGPIAMVALAKAFAELPLACRPRSVEFAFTAAHFYQSTGTGAGRYAEVLDEEYRQGKVSFAFVIEHLGAREYAAPARAGGPGSEMKLTGRPEMLAWFVSESPPLVTASSAAIVNHDLRRTVVLRGADAPDARVPLHCSMGGEGVAYHRRLIPTVALIAGPWSLFAPAFGVDELVDSELMREQTLAIGDVILAASRFPREAIAGGATAYRAARDLGAPGCPSSYPWRPE